MSTIYDNGASLSTNLALSKGCVISSTGEITVGFHPQEMRDVPQEGFGASTTGPETRN